MKLEEILVRPVQRSEETRYQALMQAHHYLGALPKIGETLWYVVTWHDQWVALLSFSAAAWKCAVRDRWIGWDFRHQYDRLHLLANNSRFLILPHRHRANLASRTLSLCQKRLPEDWLKTFGHPLVLLETFVDPQRFAGTLYKAANWSYLGHTKGFRRTRQGYTPMAQSPKLVFVMPLQAHARVLLSRPTLEAPYRHGAPKIMLSADQMYALPDFFRPITDPRRAQGRRHPLPTVLAIAAGASLCGMRGYKAIAGWARSLGPKARERFGCRRQQGRRSVPSEYVIRDVLIGEVPVFHPVRVPTAEQLQTLLNQIIKRVMKLLTRLGYLVEEQDMLFMAETDTDAAMAPLHSAACTYRIAFGPRAGQKVLSLQSVPSFEAQPPQQRCANAQGFSLHAEVRCAMNQRNKLEQLCRYITRPAIANDRLQLNRTGDVVLKLKSPYRDGTTHIVMTPLEFMQRLAALVPRPRLNLIRFHGVLAPNAKLRPQIIPGRPVTANDPDGALHYSTSARMSWARLLKRVFDIDVEHCPHCGGKLKIIAAIEEPGVIAKILAYLGLPTRAPPRSPARSFDLLETA